MGAESFDTVREGKSYKVEVKVFGDEKFYSNGIRLATKEEAEGYGRDLTSRWTLAEKWRVSEDEEVPNYVFEAGQLKLIERAAGGAGA